MTVVYPLTVQLDYTELKYSLRSLEKFLALDFAVLIIGDHLPEWLTGVNQIELPDVSGRKQFSIRRKILAALEYAEEILFMNDDIYLLRMQNEFPYYWHGMLKNYSESGSRQLARELEGMNRPTKHFDGHMPLIYGQEFKEVSNHFSDDCIIKSMYCNYLGIEGTFALDCKILRASKPAEVKEFIKDKHCFSTGVYSLRAALPVLGELFPNKSTFEI